MSTLNQEIERLKQAKAAIDEILVVKGVSIPANATLDTYANLINSIKTGTSSAEVTATKANVLAGTRTITSDSNDEIVEGTMPNNSGITPSVLVAGASYTIPEGYHDGNSVVTAKDLASQTAGTATAAKMLNGETATVNGQLVTGNIPSKAAATIYATTSDQTIAAGQYLSGTQTIKAVSTSNLSAGNIKTGVTVKVSNGNGDIASVAGTFCSDATITAANQILSGYVGYGKNGTKYTGNVAVSSLVSFSAAPYSATQITFTWKNPAKGAFSGVIIVGKTGSAPTSISDGTRYYKGYGSSYAASGTSTATVSGFTGGTTYYFRAFSYATKDNAEWVGGSLTANATTQVAKGSQTFTSSGTFTVPAGVTKIDIFCVGGGGGSNRGALYDDSETDSYTYYHQGAGGAGYTATKKSYSVTSGQTFTVTIGAGGSGSGSSTSKVTGGTTSFGSVLSAGGGYGGTSYSSGGQSYPTYAKPGAGGSGGGGNGTSTGAGLAGGSNGSAGGSSSYATGGAGQGTTTRAFGESSGTLYAGGGGGVGHHTKSGGAGGAGGGGAGASKDGTGSGVAAVNGTANTGGGGGASGHYYTAASATTGGSGICIVRWGY